MILNFTRIVISVICSVFSVSVIMAQSNNLPNFAHTVATELVSTNGNWVRFNPSQPNNIDLLESRIFTMPAKGTGIVAVEFKLVGADGGTAHYESGAFNRFANGGRGGEVTFTLNLSETGTTGKPFLVTFGKKGESTKFGSGSYCSAGGGGSTGMSWLLPGNGRGKLGTRWSYYAGSSLIAGAGGGSGGFASLLEAIHGKSATSYTDLNERYDQSPGTSQSNYTNIAGTHGFTVVSGGSALWTEDDKTPPPTCCGRDDLALQTASLSYNVFEYETGVIIGRPGSVLQSVKYGQRGGKPTTVYTSFDSPPYTNNYMTAGLLIFPTIKAGGAGGSGIAGGGAGSSTTNYFYLTDFSSAKNFIPTGGAGGTASAYKASLANFNSTAAEAGVNDYSEYLQSVSISQVAPTANPQSGYFMYRTIHDTTPPVINLSAITIELGNGKAYPFHSTATPISMETFAPYLGKTDGIYDNDDIKSITASEQEIGCFLAGQTIPLYIKVTDYARNSTDGLVMVTVKDSFTPVTTMEQTTDIFDPGLPYRIDVTKGSYTLTAANFPKAYDGCQTHSVVTHFTATTFDCSHAGTPQPVIYYYIDRDGNRSQNYVKTFNVVYTPTNKIYVDQAATGANTGLSWNDAFTSLKEALNYGCSGSGREIYVAKGTYVPDRSDRRASFTIESNTRVYGGFPTGGAPFVNRNPEANQTILSGEIGIPGVQDNSYHVVTITGKENLLDGFIIRGGYSDEGSSTGGGGILVSRKDISSTDLYTNVIRNCKLTNNYGYRGGAIYSDHPNTATSDDLFVQNCLFDNNQSTGDGGAVYLFNPNLQANVKQEFVNCAFQNNTTSGKGGALYNIRTDLKIVNCTFAYNNAGSDGGALYNGGTATLQNSILYFNPAAGAVNEIYNQGTITANYNNIQGSGGSADWKLVSVQNLGHNIDTNPQFRTYEPGMTLPLLSLSLGSTSRNVGFNDFNTEPFDLSGAVRISQEIIDLGAYEANSVVYVASDAAPGGDGNSWATAFNNLSDALYIVKTTIRQREIWIKEGNYRPDRLTVTSQPTPGNRENHFELDSYSMLYGGFAGNETSIHQRNIGLHPTILNGDIGAAGNASDNVYHVIVSPAGFILLDGLIVEGGNANGVEHNSYGGGLLVYTPGGGNSMIKNCVFRNNHATSRGGAAYVTGSRGTSISNYVQCLFYGNNASRGAATYVDLGFRDDNHTQNLYHITAYGNIASEPGSGAFEVKEFSDIHQGYLNFYNSLLVGNLPEHYKNLVSSDRITLHHTYTASTATGIFTNATSPSGRDGKIMTADDGFQLISSSPAIGAGESAITYRGIEKDITGSDRTVNLLDVGAYESPYRARLTSENGVIYVRETAKGTEDGSSWENATNDLHNAIHTPGVQKVFVAIGNYKVGDHSFIMRNGVAIYGGFDPNKGVTDLSHRRIMPGMSTGSVLDGENVRPVIWNIFDQNTTMNRTAVLDGFTITRGAYTDGAGVRNVYASPTLNNLLIRGNNASNSGGGVYNSNSSPLIINSVIAGNQVNTSRNIAIRGAGIASFTSSSVELINVTITDNILTAPVGTTFGAGLHNYNSSPKIYNSIFFNNSKNGNPLSNGADIETEVSGTVTIKNSITQTYSTGNVADHNKVNVNPQLSDGYQLEPTSPAVDAGENSYYIGLNADSKDLAGNPRVYRFADNKSIDMGAFENNRIITRWYVNAAQNSSPQNGSSWSTAFSRLEDGLAAAAMGDTVWVAKGSYTPAVGETFGMKTGVEIYGGFAGTEQKQHDRDMSLGYNSILSGNGNSVILNNNVNGGALLDGFIIQNGNTTARGGGVLNINTSARFNNLVILNNRAVEGGGIANENSQVEINNSVFYSNVASQTGGAIFDMSSSTNVFHSTFYKNSASAGAVSAQRDGSNLVIGNSISWDNLPSEWHQSGTSSTSSISFSLLQASREGSGNLHGQDPKFQSPDNAAGFDGVWFTADDGLRASDWSPYVNKGNNALAAEISEDIGGTARVQNSIVDLGPYESHIFHFCEVLASSGNNTLYVNSNVSASGNGLTWGAALKTLNEALDIANYCERIDEIWLAEGTYYPTGAHVMGDRTQSFLISRGNLHLKGGFSATNTQIRNSGLYKTILSGNINDEDLPGDNSFHVLTLKNANGEVSLDGFVITGGMADGTAPSDQAGGGVYNIGQGDKLIINNTKLSNNHALSSGGAIYSLTGNLALTNVAMTDNSATTNGGAIKSENGILTLTNVTLAGNQAANSLYVPSGTMLFTNSIVYGAITGSYSAQYSLVEGNTSVSNGNLDATNFESTEVFQNSAFGDYSLAKCSPAINAGTPDVSVIDLPETDLSGIYRIHGGRIDMGAYENIVTDIYTGIVYNQTTIIRSQKENGTTTYMDACNSLAISVTTYGATDNISGGTTVNVWLDTQQNKQYVKRHFQIMPQSDPHTTTGRVTLYFTQQEFDDFNKVNSYKLPTNADDSEGKARVLIEKRGGASSDGSGLPHSYSGDIQTINPVDVIWNSTLAHWEVSFNVTGFSGFFLKTQASALPVKWISFVGTLNDSQHSELAWKVEQTMVSHYEIEKSSNGKEFKLIATVLGNHDALAEYHFTDPVSTTGRIYYRIRQIDLDGTYSFSKIITLKGSEKTPVYAYPNPAGREITIVVGEEYVGTTLRLLNVAGIQLQKLNIRTAKTQINLNQYPEGTYILCTSDGAIVKFFKHN